MSQMTAVLREAAPAANGLRGELTAARQGLREAYLKRPSPRALLRQHAQLVDRTVKLLWQHAGMSADAALVATGGYGRGELYPCSDIDLLVLLPGEPRAVEQERLERLIRTFWDIGLEIGHSVRTVHDCVQAAASDITVNTALLESRFLAGSRRLFAALHAALGADPASFLKAKKLEQEQRHAKHQD